MLRLLHRVARGRGRNRGLHKRRLHDALLPVNQIWWLARLAAVGHGPQGVLHPGSRIRFEQI